MATPTIAHLDSTLRQKASRTSIWALRFSCLVWHMLSGNRQACKQIVYSSSFEKIAQCHDGRLIAQQKWILHSSTDSTLDSDKLDFNPITDTVDPNSTITESLACIHGFTASSDSFDYSLLRPSFATSMIRGDMPLGIKHSCYQSRVVSVRFNENAAFRDFNDTLHAPVVTQRDPTDISPNTHVQRDWADACSLGWLFSFDTRQGYKVPSVGNLTS